jgi:hypothetical protein
MNPEFIANHNGDVIHRNGHSKRLSRETVSYMGVDIDVHFDVEGYYMPATETDPAEYPLCVVRKLEINGTDVTRLLHDTRAEDEIAELIEEGWKS